MEDVLDLVSSTGQALYREEYDRERPVVCFDESSKQLLEDVRPPVKAKPGRVERYDTEYQRNGTRNLFLACEPLAGWRHVEVTERRTMQDFAHQMRWLVDEAYPQAQVVRLVLDNLNTRWTAYLYETLPSGGGPAHRPATGVSLYPEARQLAQYGGNRVQCPGLAAASSNASLMNRPSDGRSRPWSRSETSPEPPSTGGSTPTTPGANFTNCIPSIPNMTHY